MSDALEPTLDASRADLWSRLPVTEDVGWWQEQARAAPDGRVLYIGSGTGRLAMANAEHAEALVGIDADAAAVATAQARLVERPDLAGRVTFLHGRAQDLPESGHFGTVLLPSSVLNEVADPDDRLAILRRARQRCGHGGRVAIQILNPYWLATGPEVEEGWIVGISGERIRAKVVRKEVWPWSQRHAIRVVYVFGEHDRLVDDLDLVALFPLDLQRVLRRAGLEVEERWGAVPGVTPMDFTGGTWHLVCRPA